MRLKYARSFEVSRELPEPLQGLKTLAYNLRSTWHPETRELFAQTDHDLWEASSHNPVALINGLSSSRVQALVADDLYRAKLRHCLADLDNYMSAPTWFNGRFPEDASSTKIAYFCAEFGISECLPIYSGGLGVLAGDHLKAASDLGVPLVGVGLLYSRGYFRQRLDQDGWQKEVYSSYDFYRMPLKLVRNENGEPLRIQVEFPDRAVTIQAWKAQVGRVELYLLDSNILENAPHDQEITDTLYGGDQEMRIRQETILGIGGFRMLAALGIKPTVCHMNEGHAAFLSLERLRQFMADHGTDLQTARQCVVSGNVFTTHTPVPAGFDRFQRPLLEKYMTEAVGQLGLPMDDFMAMGKIEGAEDQEFNMAVLAMKNASYVNGVSKLHATVTRDMFQDGWPDYPVDEVPIASVTNGVHTLSYLSPRMVAMFDRYFGHEWRDDAGPHSFWQHVADIPDTELWELREDMRGDFVRFCRRYLRSRLADGTAAVSDLQSVNSVLDPRILTIGFARRFATYKRASLLFSDRERLKRIIFNDQRPVQFVFAGKSHPRDDGGKKLIQEIVQFVRHEGARARIVFLEDYDIGVAREMVQGVDVWLNNPRRPMEASGTSGMKVLANGGLNCSILDGWWAEGYRKSAGWAIGDATQDDDDGHQDWLDSRALYDLIEYEIAPTFYHRTENGIPAGWVGMMKSSMAELTPYFNTHRMVREYTTRFYVPASQSYQAMTSDNLSPARSALDWQQKVKAAWSGVRVGHVTDDAKGSINVEGDFNVHAEIDLGSLRPEDVRVQVLVGQVDAGRELSNVHIDDLQPVGEQGSVVVYEGTIKGGPAGHRGYIVRVVPWNEAVRIPNMLGLVAWQSVEN